MTKTQDYEGLDGVRQLLLSVEARKKNFDYNVTLLERERDLRRLKSAWESIWQEGPDFERGRARYLVSKSIAESQSEIQKSVDKGLEEKKVKIEKPKSAGRSEQPAPLARAKFIASSRLSRAKSSSCERCLKKSEQPTPQNKPRTLPKAAGVSPGKPKQTRSDDAGPLRREPPRFLAIPHPPSSKKHCFFPTRSVLTEKAVMAKERVETERRKVDSAFVPLALWQRNSIPTFCKATSTTSLVPADDQDRKSGNVGLESLQHPSMKAELKIQVLPSVHIEPSSDRRLFTNVRYVEIASHDATVSEVGEPMSDVARRITPAEGGDGSAAKKPGKMQLTRELAEKAMAICEEKMARERPACDPVPESASNNPGQDVGPTEPVEQNPAQDHVGESAREVRETTEEICAEEEAERCARESLESESSSAATDIEPPIPTPLPTPTSSRSTTPLPVDDSVRTPPSSGPSSSDESGHSPPEEQSSPEIAVSTPVSSKTDSPAESSVPELHPVEVDDVTEASLAVESSAVAEHEADEPRPMTDIDASAHTRDEFSIGEVPAKFYRRGHAEPRKTDSEGSGATTPEGTDAFELDADLTNATTSTTYSEGEVRPFRLHRSRNFPEMLALLNRAQSAQGRRGLSAARTAGDREKSLGEVDPGATAGTAWRQDSASEGEFLHETQ